MYAVRADNSLILCLKSIKAKAKNLSKLRCIKANFATEHLAVAVRKTPKISHIPTYIVYIIK